MPATGCFPGLALPATRAMDVYGARREYFLHDLDIPHDMTMIKPCRVARGERLSAGIVDA
ncbi:hypothetical protein Dd703_1624 [Musicola paradisiaca Ech703]|uniref:Uncharacterized protein n=1 Tax=Musicola paradisiaca (strain Ech703) TaxID=579405 RepID=C6C3S6_MUSP7|nr:hypothetical protein Dd703_1624 [Musicola paradisiaca Ech703]